jgi:regulatory protein
MTETDPPAPCIVTAIEPQVRNAERVSIFVDGEFTLGVFAEVVLLAGLRVGQPVSVDDLRALAHKEELRQARECALTYLGYRARSRLEIARRLGRAGFSPEAIEETLIALARVDMVNDAEFSQSWAQARTRSTSRPLGPRRITAELRQKGVERAVIDEALEFLDPALQLELALQAGQKKLHSLRGEEPAAARKKLAAALSRRGFSWEICSQVLDALLRDSDE